MVMAVPYFYSVLQICEGLTSTFIFLDFWTGMYVKNLDVRYGIVGL